MPAAAFDPRERRARRPLPLGVAGFLRDTQHLSADEVGAYLLILIAMWSRPDCDAPDDDRRLARLCRVSLRLWKSRVGPALRPLFAAAGGMLVSAWLRAEAEQIERPYREKLAKAAAEGPQPSRGRPPRGADRTSRHAGPAPAAPPATDAAEADDPAFFEAILAAAGIDWTRDVTGKWLGSTQRWHVLRWRELGLCQDEILAVVAESSPRDSPPGSLAYFNVAMQRAAGRKRAPPLEPTASGSQPRRETLDRDAFLAALNRDP